MSKWSSLELEFETESGRRLLVGLSTATGGTYEEPTLEADGVILEAESIEQPGHFVEQIPIESLTPEDRRRLENEIDKLLDDVLDVNFGEISQSVAESRADALYEAWKDREHD